MSDNTGHTEGRNASTTQVNFYQQPNSHAPQRNDPGYTSTEQQVSSSSSAQSADNAPPQSQQPLTPATNQPPVTSANTSDVEKEPVTPADLSNVNATEDPTANQSFGRKRPFMKVSNKVRKARQNARLGKILSPKDAIRFLNELKPGEIKFVVREEPGCGFAATVGVNGMIFTGHGVNSSKAKMQASENALKYLILEQLISSQQQPPAAVEIEEEKEEDWLDSEEEGGEEPKEKRQRIQPEDNIPWASLASFALYKLYLEWGVETTQPGTIPPTFTPEQKRYRRYVRKRRNKREKRKKVIA